MNRAEQDRIQYELAVKSGDLNIINATSWTAVFLNIEGGQHEGGINSPRYVEQSFEGPENVNTIDLALKYIYSIFPKFEYMYAKSEYDPSIRKFIGIDFKSLSKYELYSFIAVYPSVDWCAREEVVNERRKRADTLLKRYHRPEITKPYSDLPLAIGDKINIKQNQCWLWLGARGAAGYGIVNHEGKRWAAHRLTYTLLVGQIPEWSILLHQCDNPGCISPYHLTVGLPVHNSDDMISKGRAGFQIYPRDGKPGFASKSLSDNDTVEE